MDINSYSNQFGSEDWNEDAGYAATRNAEDANAIEMKEVSFNENTPDEYNEYQTQNPNVNKNGRNDEQGSTDVYGEDTLQSWNPDGSLADESMNEEDNFEVAGDEVLEIQKRVPITLTSFFQDVLALFICGKHKRSVQYEMLLDKLPAIIAIPLLFIVVVILIALFVLGLLVFPTSVERQPGMATLLNYHHFNGDLAISHEINNLSPANMQFLFYLRLPTSNFTREHFLVSKRDFAYKAQVSGRNSFNAPWTVLNSVNDVHRRILRCQSEEQYLYTLDSSSSNGEFKYIENACNEMIIVHQSEISYSSYRVEVTFNNFGPSSAFFNGEAITRFEVVNKYYSILNMTVRLVYSVISFILFVTFTFTMIRTQSLWKWNTQQKWLPFLLFLHIFFQNPFVIIEVLLPSAFISIINAMCTITFVYGFMLYLLVFFHSLFTRKSERNYCFYYGSKIVFIVVSYIFTSVFFIWSRLYNRADPGATSINDWANFRLIVLISLALQIIYVIWLFYYIFKAFRNSHKFRARLNVRFKMIGILSLVVLLATVASYLLNNTFNNDAGGSVFLVTHTIILIYFAISALTFVPSTQVAPPKIPLGQVKKLRRRFRFRRSH